MYIHQSCNDNGTARRYSTKPVHAQKTSSGATNLQLLPLYTLPLKQQRTEERETGTRNGHNEAPRHGKVVRGQDAGQLALGRHFSDVRGARGNDFRWIDAGSVFRDFLDQGVGEDVLRDGNGHGAAEGVEEDRDGVAGGHVLLVEHDLDRDERDLHAGACTRARQNLVADPHPSRRGGFQGVKHAGADREDGCADPGEWRIPAECGDATTDDDGGNRDADKIRDGADTRTFGGSAFDGLEVEG